MIKGIITLVAIFAVCLAAAYSLPVWIINGLIMFMWFCILVMIAKDKNE